MLSEWQRAIVSAVCGGSSESGSEGLMQPWDDLQEVRHNGDTARSGGSLMAEKAPQVTKEGKEIEAWKGL